MRISLDSGRKLVNVNKRDFVVKFKFRNYATITVRVSRLRSRGRERERISFRSVQLDRNSFIAPRINFLVRITRVHAQGSLRMFRANYQEDRIVLERLRDGFNGDIITEPRQSMRRNSCAIKFSASFLYAKDWRRVCIIRFSICTRDYSFKLMLVGNYENMGTK